MRGGGQGRQSECNGRATAAAIRHTHQRKGRRGNNLRAVGSHARHSSVGARQAKRQPRARHQAWVPRCGGVARCRQARNQQ
eukprot:5219454-Alexandrium_andersonii.AAC.1